MEVYVIYNKVSGLLEGGYGPIDRGADQARMEQGDESVMLAHIPRILSKDPDRAVIYLPAGTKFDPARHKIVDGKMVDQTAEDLSAKAAAQERERRIQAKMRELAEQALDAEGP